MEWNEVQNFSIFSDDNVNSRAETLGPL